MAATDSMPVPRKNVAFRHYFPIRDINGALVTGAAGLDSEVSKDNGSFADCSNEATEIGSTGIYYLDLTSTEMNADGVVVQVKTSTTNALTTVFVIAPEEIGDLRVDTVAISGDSTAADNLEAACDGTGYNVGGGAMVAASVTGSVGGSVLGNVAGDIGGNLSGNVNGNVAGSVASVTGNVDGDVLGDVAGNLGGNVVGDVLGNLQGTVQYVGSIIGYVTVGTINTGAITAASIASGAITSAKFASGALDAVWSTGTRTLTAATNITSGIATAVWDSLTSALTTSGSIGKRIVDYLTGDAYARLGAPAGASVSADVAAIKAETAAIVDDTGTSGVLLASSTDIYPADVQLTVDDGNTQDEWTVQWFKNGTPQTSGITSPTIQVVKRADGTDLIASTAMTQIGSTGAYKYDASGSERVTQGEAVIVVVTATINAGSRSWRKVVTRDVEI